MTDAGISLHQTENWLSEFSLLPMPWGVSPILIKRRGKSFSVDKSLGHGDPLTVKLNAMMVRNRIARSAQ